MSQVKTEDDQPLDAVQARLLARVRRLMLVSGLATMIGIAVVIGLIGLRLFRSDAGAVSDGSIKDISASLPKGAHIVGTAASGDTVVVTLDIGGVTEIRTFDAKTLRPLGRLRFSTEP